MIIITIILWTIKLNVIFISEFQSNTQEQVVGGNLTLLSNYQLNSPNINEVTSYDSRRFYRPPIPGSKKNHYIQGTFKFNFVVFKLMNKHLDSCNHETPTIQQQLNLTRNNQHVSVHYKAVLLFFQESKSMYQKRTKKKHIRVDSFTFRLKYYFTVQQKSEWVSLSKWQILCSKILFCCTVLLLSNMYHGDVCLNRYFCTILLALVSFLYFYFNDACTLNIYLITASTYALYVVFPVRSAVMFENERNMERYLMLPTFQLTILAKWLIWIR